MNRVTSIILALLALTSSRASAQPAPAPPPTAYLLVDNFTAPLASSPEIKIDADFGHAKVGLAAGQFTYTVNPANHIATVAFGERVRPITGPGTLKLWIKGDKSGNDFELTIRHGTYKTDAEGKRVLATAVDVPLPHVKMDFDEWREVTFDATALPVGEAAWVQMIRFIAPPGDKSILTGVVLLDDLRLYPTANPPTGTAAADVIGPAIRDYSKDIAAALDVRSFIAKPARVRARLTLTDRNDNTVADRDFPIDLAAGEAKEIKLDAAPDNLESFVPPFKISVDIISSDLPDISSRIDRTLVMGNSVILFEDFSDVIGRWFTAGYGAEIRANVLNWNNWTHGENPRFSALPQTSARITRVAVDPAEAAAAKGPPSRWAMKLDYTGEAAVYSGADRFLPGQAYKLGVWVKGDGSGADLSVLTLDFTNVADFWIGGWKRINTGERSLGAMTTKDWHYVEVDLPGNGQGVWSTRGSTDDIDLPLEVTAFRVTPVKPDGAGSVLIGPIFAATQQPPNGAIALMLGYDDANEHKYLPDKNAFFTVQNAWRAGSRQVKCNWTLLDRADQPIASGQADASLAAGEAKSFPIPLADHAKEIAPRAGPLRLQVTVTDAHDVSASPSRQLILAKTDAVVPLADFESERGYLGLKASGTEGSSAGAPGESVAFTTADQAHSGKRSLAIAWDKTKLKHRFVSIDPPVPGIATELSMWVFGDGSGALFYPLIGDRRGVNMGAPNGQWDLFLPRTAAADAPLQNAVRVDWKGWREVKFFLPPIAPNWATDLPILAYVPDYPLGVHLTVIADAAQGDAGTIYIDDISAQTHLPADARLAMEFVHDNDTNVVKPGTPLLVALSNFDAAQPRSARLVGGIYDWRNAAVVTIDSTPSVKPGERLNVAIAPNLPAGSYAVRLALRDGERTLATIDEDVLVADLEPVLTKDWRKALVDPWKLRAAVRDKATFVDEDWDWIEFYPGNTQLDSIRLRTNEVIANGCDPYLLLGYSAYWASGIGFDQMKTGAFVRRVRHIGSGVDVFMIPQRMEDWDLYVREVIRGIANDVAGYYLWQNPDGTGSLAVEPSKLAKMLESADKWRNAYCPTKPLLIGGMSRDTAIPYLNELGKLKALDHLGGVNVRIDVGRLSPEDAEVAGYVRQLRDALHATPEHEKTIILTDLDWAIEKDPTGFNGFDQAAYLVRSTLLLSAMGIQPSLSIRNEDDVKLGLGLTYRNTLTIPPMTERLPTLQLRPGWWAIVRARQWLDQLKPAGEVDIRDVVPQRTRCVLFERKADGKSVAIVWRNDDPGFISLANAGLTIASAEDVLGAPVAATKDGWYPIGKMPTVFVLGDVPKENPAALALERARVRDADDSSWPQRVLAAFTPATGQRQAYVQTGGTIAQATTRTVGGEDASVSLVRMNAGATEKFEVDAPADADLVLRKRFVLDETGQQAEVFVNGASAGKWNLATADKQLGGGVRDAIYLIDRKLLAGKPRATIEIKYAGAANTIAWDVLEYRGGDFPLSAVGAIHANQNVGHPRAARNMIGAPIKVGTTPFANGLGVFARSLTEYPINGQFTRFTAKVGVDGATEGRGSVVFEVYADGKKVWASPVMSGLDAPKDVDVDVKGVDRLRLVVTDAGDGNKFDAADWCDPVLKR